MKKPNQKPILVTVALLILTLAVPAFTIAFPAQACGCGVLVAGGSNYGESGWDYGNDADEVGYINYQNGVEELTIGLDIQERDTSAVLIVPVPAKPQDIKPDILDESPDFSGRNIETAARESLNWSFDTLTDSQFIPKWLLKFSQTDSTETKSLPGSDGAALGNSLADTKGTTVVVHEHIELNGMIAEVISAEQSRDLYDYLNEKGLYVPTDSISVLQDYIGKDFSFLASWIDRDSDNSAAQGLYVSFPTDEIYYPLIPGSAYPDGQSEQAIYINGYVSPKIFDDIRDDTVVEYYKADNGHRYTKITINAQPEQLTEDLWIANQPPLHTLAQDIFTNKWVPLLVTWLVATAVATFISLKYIVKDKKLLRSWKVILVAGLSGLTSIGTIAAGLIFFQKKTIQHWIGYKFVFIATAVLVGLLLSLISLTPLGV